MEQLSVLGWLSILLLWVTCGALGYLVGKRCEVGPTGLLLGLLLGPLGILITFALDARKTCPRCQARLDQKTPVCPLCEVEVFWEGTEPRIDSPIEGERVRREHEQKRTKEASVEEWRRRLVESNAVNARRRQQVEQIKRESLHWILGLPVRFDRGLRDFLGQENELVYRFTQVLLYVIVPLVFCVLVILNSSAPQPSQPESLPTSSAQVLPHEQTPTP